MDTGIKKIVFAVTNDLSTDQRLHRICSTLSNEGIQVTLVGRRRRNMFDLSAQPFNCVRLRILFNQGFLFYASYNIQLFFYLLFKSCHAIVANDIDTLPACWLAASIRGKILVFDAHELFTEVPELVNRPLVRHIWQVIENLLLPGVKASYTVNDSLARYYSQRYKIQMEVFRNLPVHRNPGTSNLPVIPGAQGKHIILYQGSVNLGRGLELMIETMPLLSNAIFLIIGEGDVLEKLKSMVLRKNLTDRVIFISRQDPETLYSYTVQASIGISVEEHLGLNYYYASPNKLYDYIQARVPVLVSAFPEMKSLVENYGIGLCVESRNSENLASQINLMLEDQSHRSAWKENLNKAAEILTWEFEQVRLLEFYKQLNRLRK
jgi:glycosyltransferase involved in cell wall biosynthesis